MKLDEILSKPLPFKVVERTKAFYSAEFVAGKREIIFSAHNEDANYGDEDQGEWIIEFGEIKSDGMVSHGKTGSGNEFDVFATLKAIIDDFISKCNPKMISFSADKDKKNNRARVYAKLFQKNLPAGWKINTDDDTSSTYGPVFFDIVREALNKPKKFNIIEAEDDRFKATFKVDDRLIRFDADEIKKGKWVIIFGEVDHKNNNDLKTKQTHKGNEIEIFATIKSIFERFLEIYKPETMIMDSSKEEPKRAKLYDRLLTKFLDTWEVERNDNHPNFTTFTAHRML